MTDSILEIEKRLTEQYPFRNKKRLPKSATLTGIDVKKTFTDESSVGDYEDKFDSFTGWDIDYEYIKDIDTWDFSDLDFDWIKPDIENPDSFKLHTCNQEDALLVCLGIRYALTFELPTGYTPFLLINIILEGCIYFAFTGHGNLDRFVADKDRVKEFVDPCDEWCIKESPKYYRQAFFYDHYLRRVAKQGPFAHHEKQVPVPYRHRPWNSFFRQSIPAVLKVNQATENYEGIPHFIQGKVQRAEFRITTTKGRSTVTIVRGQKIREILNDKDYEEYTRKRKYRKVIKQEKVEETLKEEYL